MQALDTRAQIVQAAQSLFRQHGVAATSLQQLAAAAGVPKGSIAFHFPRGKRDIVLQTVKLSADELGEALAAGLDTEVETGQTLVTLMAMIGAMLEHTAWQEGCPLATIALECSGDDELRHAVDAGFTRWVQVIGDRFRRDGIPEPAATDLAHLVMATVEGTLVLCRARRDLEPMVRAVRPLEQLLRSEIARARAHGPE